mgnify:FL=1
MARPKKDKCITYTKDVHFRLTETESEILQKTAQDANLSISEYVRKVLNNQKVIVNYNLVADVPEIKKLLAEFGKIGSNLNQIAKYFNQGGILSQEMRGQINKLNVI